MNKYILLFLFSCNITQYSIAQTLQTKGTIFNQITNTPIPFVNIGIKGTYNGTTTNSNGEFFMNGEKQTISQVNFNNWSFSAGLKFKL